LVIGLWAGLHRYSPYTMAAGVVGIFFAIAQRVNRRRSTKR
jgi:hypothetical protein